MGPTTWHSGVTSPAFRRSFAESTESEVPVFLRIHPAPVIRATYRPLRSRADSFLVHAMRSMLARVDHPRRPGGCTMTVIQSEVEGFGGTNTLGSIIAYLSFPADEEIPHRVWIETAKAIRRLISRSARRKGINPACDDLTQDIFFEIEVLRQEDVDWSGLSNTNFETQIHRALWHRVMLTFERVLDRHRPRRQPIHVRRSVAIEYDIADHRRGIEYEQVDVDELLRPLTGRQKEIVREIVLAGKNFRQVAKEMGLSEQQTRMFYQDAILRIRESH
jgi:DNA-directed RNA polymerase specialized sigma24 family protein